jgi:phosphohistidine phosphatase
MKTLYLLRHAKSDWADGSLRDQDRPLNARGRAAAPAMAAYMAKQAYVPDVILCSAARRTVQTLDLVLRHTGFPAPVRYEDALYLAEWRQMLERIKWIEEPFAAALIVGHNPGTEQLALALAGSGVDAEEKARRALMREKYPTAALAVLRFPVSAWRGVAPGTGTLADFVRPRDLDGVDAD